MVGRELVITTAEALEACIARGRPRAVCDEIIASQMVDGAYCDGTIVISAEGRRCVPRELSDLVQDARDAQPLPPVDSEIEPARARASALPWVIGGAVLIGVVVWLSR